MKNDDASKSQDETQRIDPIEPSGEDSASELETQRIDLAGASEQGSASESEAQQSADADTSDLPDAPSSDRTVPDSAFAPLPVDDSTGPAVSAQDLPVVDGTYSPSGEAAQAQALEKKRRGWQIALAIVIAIVALAGIVYGGGVYYYSSHFLPNTELYGKDVSNLSEGEVATLMSGTVDGYALKVTGDGVNLRIPGDNIDISYDGDAFAKAAMEQVEKWQWPFELTKQHSYTVTGQISYDTDKVAELLNEEIDRVNANATESTDATVSYDSDKNKFVVVSETYGTKLDAGLVSEVVTEALESLQTSLVLDESERDQPEVTRDDERLSQAAAAANVYRKCSIPLTVNGKTVYTVKFNLIQQWINISDSFKVSIDGDAIKTWAQGDLSDKYDTVGKKRTYTLKANGKAIKKVTVSGGTYGWTLDGASLAKKLKKRIKSTNNSELEIPMSSTAAKWNPGGADWTRYIDIDLTTQHARLISASGKVLWESDIVSGLPKDGRATPTGVYTITSYMGRDQTLVGSDEDGDGEPDYETPVSYWMPFVGNSVALHDADWRSSFGGSIYKTSGSHGCVNLPSSKAAELYSMVHVGDVVVSHK
ncbi:MAG: L,D-transpeptidase family protein [Coriobacteriales bacterium]|jgi:lipoprotein-anchoring transpeptidase ErfK/SrfK